MLYSNLLKSNEFQTPSFLIREDVLEELSNDIEHALKVRWPQGIIGYSFKTNNLPWLISYFKKKGFFAEVVSSDEFDLALESGYAYDKIIFNGPVKDRLHFESAVRNGTIVNIDSKRELLWLSQLDEKIKSTANIGLRVNFCLENYCHGESQCGNDDGRFGFSFECGELKAAIDFLNKNGIKLKGLHLHCSSKTRSLRIYRAIAETASKIIDLYDLKLDYIDIGGGYFGGMPDCPSFDDYFSTVYEVLKKYEQTYLLIEPGMSIIGAGVDYVTSVVDTKKTLNNRFAVLDGSRTHIDPFMRKTKYSFEIVNMSDGNLNTENGDTVLCGFTCMENDRFFSINDNALVVGDKVVFTKVGAYTMGLSPQFIEFYPTVYSVSNGKVKVVRPKVSAKGFIMLNRGDLS